MTPAPTKPSEALRAARDLLSDPKRWTQGVSARTADDVPTDALDERAVCFCAIGALERVGRTHIGKMEAACSFIKKAVRRAWVDTWNDDTATEHSDIIAGFTRAIALAEEAGQ